MSTQRKRLKYSKPCDECSRRKIKCDLYSTATLLKDSNICSNCHEFGRKCTDSRKRLKSGPKPSNTSPSTNIKQVQCLGMIPLKKLLPCFECFQAWFYVFWPVINADDLISKLSKASDKCSGKIILDDSDTAMTYSMCCALASAISKHFTRDDYSGYLSSNHEVLLDSEVYAKEARRIVFMFELDLKPCTDLLLYNIFLSGSYGSVEKFMNRGIMCLREAVSIAQILGMHCIETYKDKSKEETHLWRKIYYMIFVIERFQCFRFQCYQLNLSVLLDASIPLPNLEDERYPDLLVGFNELIQVFIAADKQFLDTANRNVSVHHKDEQDELNKDPFWITLNNMLMNFNTATTNNTDGNNSSVSKDSLIKFQSRLSAKDHSSMLEKVVDDSQILNILLTKAWLQTLGWSVARENHLLDTNKYTSIDSLSITFPLEVATDFLASTNKFPEIVFARNGPGICLKLLQIVDALHEFVVISDQTSDPLTEQMFENEWLLANDRLFSLVQKIDKFRCFDYKIPTKVLMNIKAIQDSKPLSNTLTLSALEYPDQLQLSESLENGRLLELRDLLES